MRLDFFMLADRAERGEATKINILGGAVTHVTAPSFPFVLPRLCVVLRFFYEGDEDQLQDHLLTVVVIAPDGKEIAGVRGQLGPATVETGRRHVHPGEDSTLFVVATLEGLSLNRDGRYTFRVLVDDIPVGEQGIAAVLQEAPTE